MRIRRVVVSLVIAAVALLSVVPLASARPPSKAKIQEKFYLFGKHDISAIGRKPSVTHVSAAERPKFERLLRLKRSFMSRLYQTDRLKAFK
jgi:hypothetical protein